MSQTSLLDNALNTLRRRTSLRDGLRLFRTSSKDSLKSTKSKKQSSTYHPYAVYEQTMFPIILRDPEATTKLLETILETPNGRRSLSRLARTCSALSGPALDILWRELDSIAPIVGLFPGHLLKKTRKPGMGLNRLPRDEDWKAIIKYSERIHRIAYDESANNIATSIFSIFEECRPQGLTYILPRLQELNWKVDTPAALERSATFLNPRLQVINLELGSKFPKINDYLADLSSRTKLKGFSFISPTSLPEAFTELLIRQDGLEKVVLVAPGALGPGVGRWVASLPQLKQLQLDLTGRSPIAVEGFFDELRPRSGDSTPSSIGSRDSGVFSGEELDFTEIRKSALRLTGDLPSKGSFAKLRKLQLTGEVANIAVFLKHLDSALVHLDLVIEDPPDNADWQDLSELICDRFAESLQSLRISATPSSRFADLVRSTSRAEPPSGRLSLERFTGLSSLVRLDIDLPESIVFIPADIEAVAMACPNLESLKLCPLSRFPPPHSPKLFLESLAPLVKNCRRLHTLGVVFNAGPSKEQLLKSQEMSSPSLLRLHVGHSWANDPLQISIFLSHFMPRLELLKWFQEKNRVGFNEGHAKNWQSVSDTLPYLQLVRSTEKSFAQTPLPQKAETSEKSVDATVRTMSRAVFAQVTTSEASIQFSPILEDRGVEAKVEVHEVSIDAAPPRAEIGIEAIPMTATVSVSAVDPPSSNETVNISSTSNSECSPLRRPYPNIYLFSSLFSLFSLAYRYAIFPISLPSRILHLALSRFQNKTRQTESNGSSKQPSSEVKTSTNDATDSIPLENLPVRQ
ncbi:hypothetical protein GALMADRAFT_132087 [Galerina marginata CBS 339.88]|uniref:F-box domain-containing protein n=1 Tax=Galerina marginata (strain CBS 339.88) TaxID=685588 RepID=A0A067TZD3_GALM3|nr:hypothetical protein GALMADRAFT_132087 [Galerina marginata CBS 339.88]